ncbi:Ldh family oxidoreductase [Tranquillimonas alkanivorans]|uniref:Malate/lactate/ureidoglycolate dehydrogenase, LDH2 family n=1 Tax=Tranquillimonas alkanivorans TaxID=441119 RepID=A0A1I5NU37_9RHOB|nr:Ldh family oxidoreductase [Tranquillimonas alkanivorans]SFP25318.1 Malate/lactate/ureidoglycolate dehydrogenase, LDH2 family [Tranquillimonas alkanivorans]
MQNTFSREDLCDLARSLLTKGGLAPEKAEVVAELLIRTDEMGVTTHGISMVPYYLPELASGNMTSEGTHEVVRDTGATMVWDGNYLPGHWLMTQALDTCMDRARTYGMAGLAMRRSHHIGCLSTLTRIAAEQGLVCYIATSDPSGKWVAPYGGTEPTLTPNPWAVGYPGGEHPVLIDTCASITTVSKVREHINSGTRFEHPWMLDARGRPTTDPTVVNADPPGTLLPVGGIDHGHKGYAMALHVEMQTQALSGHGRADAPSRWGGNVFIQVMDPEAFGGADAFVEQVAAVNALCRENRPAEGLDRVRVPGDGAHARLASSRAEGVRLPDEVWRRVSACAREMDVALP